MEKHTLETAKYAMSKIAEHFRNNVQIDYKNHFSGFHHTILGEVVILYCSGSISILSNHLPSFELKDRQKEMEDAYTYYRQVRSQAKIIANEMLKEKLKYLYNEI